MFRDPIVEEVRAIREQLAAKFDFDIRKIIADAQKRQAKSKSNIVSFQENSTLFHGAPLRKEEPGTSKNK